MRKRNHRVVVYFDDSEYSSLLNKVNKSGMSREAFLRKLVAEVQIKEAPHADVPMLIREMKRVGYNIDQILKRMNSGNIIDLPQFRKDMEDLRNVTRMVVEEHYK